jgi:hypothetical protein
LNPASAKVPQGTVLSGRALLAFQSQKAHIDQVIAHASSSPLDAGTRSAALRQKTPSRG